MPASPDTLLQLILVADNTDRIPLYAARGISQTLEPIDQAKSQRRTVNGELVDLSLSRFHQYKSRISCSDQRPPALDGIFPGATFLVKCAYRLAYPTIGGMPSRDEVSGSSFTEGDFTFYEPVLTMMVADHSGNFAEWEAGVEWWIEFNEVSVPT